MFVTVKKRLLMINLFVSDAHTERRSKEKKKKKKKKS